MVEHRSHRIRVTGGLSGVDMRSDLREAGGLSGVDAGSERQGGLSIVDTE